LFETVQLVHPRGRGSDSASPPLHESPTEVANLRAPKYRPDIDGLRAIAVLLVVTYHAFPSLLPGGFIGVDVFFVLSGYLISTIIFENLEAGRFSLMDFYIRRVRRIFPALITVLISCLATGWFVLLAPDYAMLGKHVAGGAGFAAYFVLWLEAGYFDVSAELKLLLHLWSLGIEEQYYLVWPLMVWCIFRPQRNLYPILIALFLSSLSLNLWHTATDKTAAFYSPLSRFWEILLGSLLSYAALRQAHARSDIPGSRYANARSLLGASLLAIGLLVTNKESPFPGWRALLPTLGTALILSGGLSARLNTVLLSSKPLVWIGLISFPLYLWHWPLLTFARIETGATPPALTRVILVSSSFILAWVTYVLVERPLRFGRHGRGKALFLTALMALTGVAGICTLWAQGYPLRFPEIIRSATSFIDFGWGTYVRSDKCHLHVTSATTHDSACFETTRPLVVLWGDSHAASLYPGLKSLQSSEKFGIIQATQAGCPPLIGLDNLNYRKNCKQVNDLVFERLIEIKPEMIILHSTWWSNSDPLSDETLYEKTKSTAKIIKERLPGSRVVIIGPMPSWSDGPQKVIYRAWQQALDKTKEPPVMLEAAFLTSVDQALRKAAAETNTEYFSPTDYLCEGNLCISRIGNRPLDIIGTDDRHLSPNGSVYLVEKLKTKLLNPILQASPSR